MVQSIEDVRRRRDRGARVPPHNLHAEESLLGAMLLSRDAIGDALQIVRMGHFYKPAHGHVFEAITALYNSGEPADVVTVAEALRQVDLLDAVGGESALLALQTATPATSNAAHYARIVEEKALMRRLIEAGSEITDIGFDAPDEVNDALDAAESLVFKIAEGRVTDSTKKLDALLADSLEILEERYRNPGATRGIPSGFRDLDKLLGGLQPSALLVLGARPAMGKSALALNIATRVAVGARRPVLFFSLEMGHLELTERILASEARVESSKLREGNLSDSDWTRVTHAVGRLGDAPLFIDENPNVSVMEIRAKARRKRSELGDLGLIVVDYLQLMSSRGRVENRQNEVAEISRGLKILARELDVPVIALSQLSRALEQRNDKRPMLADLRESGAIEQDADVVMFLYRDEKYNEESTERGIAQLIVAKHRSGPTGVVRFAFLDHLTLFSDMAHDPQGL